MVFSIYEMVQSAFAMKKLAILQDCWASDLRGKIDAMSEFY